MNDISKIKYAFILNFNNDRNKWEIINRKSKLTLFSFESEYKAKIFLQTIINYPF